MSRELVVIQGPNDPGLSKSIAKDLNALHVNVYKKVFPDGEIYLRIPDPSAIKNKYVVFVNTLYPEQNASWIETLLLANAIANINVIKTIAVIPYLAYSRQDKIFLEGEPISIHALLKALKANNVDYLLTVDIHNPKILETWGAGSYNIPASDLLAKEALHYVNKPVVIAPDKGAINRAKEAAKAINTDYDYLVKKRDKITGEVTLEPKEIDISGRDVIIIDDIISTGSTIALAAEKCRYSGAKTIVVAATHLLLVGNAYEKIISKGVKMIIGANTVNKKFSVEKVMLTDISKRISEKIKSIIGF